MTTENQQEKALQALRAAVSEFGEITLAGLAAAVIDEIERAIYERDGRVVCQMEYAESAPLRVTFLLAHTIDGDRALVPLAVIEESGVTLQ